MDGLDRIARLRGGFDGMRDDIPLLASWIDLAGAVVYDIKPRLPLPLDIAISVAHELPRIPPCVYLDGAGPRLAPVAQALRLMSSVAVTVNANADDPLFWKGDMNAARMIGPVTHSLLSMPRLSEAIPGEAQPEDHEAGLPVLAEMLRLACLVLLAALKMRLSLPTWEMVALQSKFQQLLDRKHDTYGLSEPLRSCQLMALVTTALFANGDDRANLVAEIRRVMAMSGLETGHEAIESVRWMLWIDSIESQSAEKLSQEIDRHAAQSPR